MIDAARFNSSLANLILIAFVAWSPSQGALSGRVVDTGGKAVAGVSVVVDRLGGTVTTDALGRFSIATTAIRKADRNPGLNHGSARKAYTLLGQRIVKVRGNPVTGIGNVPIALGKAVAASAPVAADTLTLSKTGFLINRMALSKSDGDLGDIMLFAGFTGVPEKYHGFNLYRFTVAGKNALVVVPNKVKAGNPWLWRTYFWDHKPLFDSILCANGYYLAFMDIPDMFGAPSAVSLMDSMYAQMTIKHGFSKKANLFGISRGGLYLYNWAGANLGKVSTMYGDGAVMDFESWPCGCYGTGAGSAGDWSLLKSVYGFSGDAQAKAYGGNPVRNMKPFALAKIPIIHVYGEIDNVVPPKENVLRANDSLKAYGWQMKLLAKPNTGHVHGVTADDGGLPGQLDTLVQFVLRNTTY